VRLRRGHEHVDLVEAIAQLKRAVEPPFIGNEDRAADRRRDVDRPQHVGGIRQLGDDVGADEAGQLQALQARAGEAVDERHLGLCGDDLRLVLKAVPGADLADAGGRDHAPSARAMTICCTSSVPSPIVRIFASR
jgi:hypothetical protein